MKTVRLLVLLLLLNYYFFVIPQNQKSCAAGNVTGVNIGPNYSMFDSAKSLVGAGGWVYVLGQIGDCASYEDMFSSAGNVNIIIRGHYPNTTLEPDLAKSWAATLANMNTYGHKVFFMPVNEPNNPSEVDGSGNSHSPGVVKAYTDTLMQELDAYGIRGSKVVLLSPLLDQHNTSYEGYFNSLGGAGYFSSFDGISMNLYDLFNMGQPLSDPSSNRNAGKYRQFLNERGLGQMPVYAVESGPIVDGRVQYIDNEVAKYVNAAAPVFKGDSNFKMFGIFAYDPHYAIPDWDLTNEGSAPNARSAYRAQRTSGSFEPASIDQAALTANIDAKVLAGVLERCPNSCGVVINGRTDLCKGSSENELVIKRLSSARGGEWGITGVWNLDETYVVRSEFSLDDLGGTVQQELFAGGHWKFDSFTDPADRSESMRYGEGVVSKGLLGMWGKLNYEDDVPAKLFIDQWVDYLRYDYQQKCAGGLYLLGECVTSNFKRYTSFCPPPELYSFSDISNPTKFTPARGNNCRTLCPDFDSWEKSCKDDWQKIPMFDNPDVVVKNAGYVQGCEEGGVTLTGGTIIDTKTHQVRGINNVTSALNAWLNDSGGISGFDSSGPIGNYTAPIVENEGPGWDGTQRDWPTLNKYYGFLNISDIDRFSGNTTIWQELQPGYSSQSPLPVTGRAMYYGSGIMENVYANRLRWGQITPCPECIGRVALLREGDINRRVFIKLPYSEEWFGPYHVIDVAGRNDIGDLFIKGWAVDVGYNVWQDWNTKFSGLIPKGPIDNVVIADAGNFGYESEQAPTTQVSSNNYYKEFQVQDNTMSKEAKSQKLSLIPKLKNAIGLSSNEAQKIIAETYPVRTLVGDGNSTACGQVGFGLETQVFEEGGNYRIEWRVLARQTLHEGYADVSIRLPDGSSTISKLSPASDNSIAIYCSSGFVGCGGWNGAGPVNVSSLPASIFVSGKNDLCSDPAGQVTSASCSIDENGKSDCLLADIIASGPVCTPPSEPANYQTTNLDTIEATGQALAIGPYNYNCTIESNGNGAITCGTAETKNFSLWGRILFAEHNQIYGSIANRENGLLSVAFTSKGIQPDFQEEGKPILAGVTSTAVRYCDSTSGTPGGVLVGGEEVEGGGCYSQIKYGIPVFPPKIGEVRGLGDWVEKELLSITSGTDTPDSGPITPEPGVRPIVSIGDGNWIPGSSGVAQTNPDATESTYYPNSFCSLEKGTISVDISVEEGKLAGVVFNSATDNGISPQGYFTILRFDGAKGLYVYMNENPNEFDIDKMTQLNFVPIDLSFDAKYTMVIDVNVELGKHQIKVLKKDSELANITVNNNRYKKGRIGFVTSKAVAYFTNSFAEGECGFDSILAKEPIPTSLTGASGVEVYASRISGFNFGDYRGSITPAPPHAEGNPRIAVTVVWRDSNTKSKVRDESFVFWREKANIPFFELPYNDLVDNKRKTMGASFGYYEGNLSNQSLTNSYGRQEENSVVNILKNDPNEVVIEWIYYVVDNSLVENNRLYKVVEYYYIYPSGIVQRQAKLLDSYTSDGYSYNILSASIMNPTKNSWLEVLDTNDINESKMATVGSISGTTTSNLYASKEVSSNPFSKTNKRTVGDNLQDIEGSAGQYILLEPKGFDVFAVYGSQSNLTNLALIGDPRSPVGYSLFTHSIIGMTTNPTNVAENLQDINSFPTETYLVDLYLKDIRDNVKSGQSFEDTRTFLYFVKKDTGDTNTSEHINEAKNITKTWLDSIN